MCNKKGIEYLLIVGQHQLLTGTCRSNKAMANITYEYKHERNITKSSFKWNTVI